MRTIGIAIAIAAAVAAAPACSKNDKSSATDPANAPEGPTTTDPKTADPKTADPNDAETPPVDAGGGTTSTATPKIDSNAAFYIRIEHTRGERSRDSNSTHSVIELADRAVHFVETPAGAHSDRRKSYDFTVELSDDEVAEIRAIITEQSIMTLEDSVMRDIELDGPHRYRSASVTLRVDGAEHTFKISGVFNGAGATDSETWQDIPSVAGAIDLFDAIARAAKKRVKHTEQAK